MSAAAVRSTSVFCSVMSTAMPIRCTPGSPGCCTSSQRARSQHPFAAGMQHAEFVVDGGGLGVGQLRRHFVEP
jgi:hypothetical protein